MFWSSLTGSFGADQAKYVEQLLGGLRYVYRVCPAECNPYARLLLGCLFVVGLAILGLGLVRGLTLEKLILAVMLPLSPALLVAARQFSEQTAAASRLTSSKGMQLMWPELCAEGDRAELAHKSRSLQDEIYDNRKCNSSVFDWMFQRVRTRYESQMNYTAQQLVDEAKQRMRIS